MSPEPSVTAALDQMSGLMRQYATLAANLHQHLLDAGLPEHVAADLTAIWWETNMTQLFVQ